MQTDKILIVSNGFPPNSVGGVEVYTEDLARGLSSRGFSVIVFARESDRNLRDYQLIENIHENNIKIYKVINDYKEVKSFEAQFVDIKIDEIFTEILQTEQPNTIIFNHLIALSANLLKISFERRIPYITYLHDFWPICHRVNLFDYHNQVCPGPIRGGDCFRCLTHHEDKYRAKLLRLGLFVKRFFGYKIRHGLRRLIDVPQTLLPNNRSIIEKRYKIFLKGISDSNLVLVPSQYLKKIFEGNGYLSEQIKVLPLGVKKPAKIFEIEKAKNNMVCFGFVGNVLPIKGLHVLLTAFQGIEKNISLKIFGRNDIDKAYTTMLMKIKGNNDRIEFLGKFDPENRDLIYSSLDSLIIPSIVPESFSLVAREALIRKIPVIASDIGALSEIVVSGKNGFLVKPNSVTDLQHAINSILDTELIQGKIDSPEIITVDKHLDLLLEYIRVILHTKWVL